MNPAYRHVNEIVQKEINYLKKLYPYNINKFLDKKLLHASSIFSFNDNKTSLEDKFFHKLLNLMAGMELLAAGLKLHNFNPDDFILLVKEMNLIKNPDLLAGYVKPSGEVKLLDADGHNTDGITAAFKGKKYVCGTLSSKRKKNKDAGNEKNYTLDLLFGDILYSRASIYILEYGDHELFNTILNSLKSVHSNKLILHQELVRTIKVNNNVFLNNETICKDGRRIKLRKNIIQNETFIKSKVSHIIEENEILITGMSSLLKTAFITGWGIFSHFRDIDFPYKIINDFILFKTFNDLKGFFTNLPAEFNFLKNLDFIQQREKIIKDDLTERIGRLKPDWMKKNFQLLQKLYT